MFDTLSERLGGILDRLTRRGALTEADVDAAMREVRRALLEADVALEVVRTFTEKVREEAVGATVVKSVTPGQMLDSLERVAGPAARARVRTVLDERIMQIVCSWPGTFDVSRALHLGFSADRDIDGIIRQFVDSRQGAA